MKCIPDLAIRAAEKQKMRDQDAEDLKSGAKTLDQLRAENAHFRSIAHEAISWKRSL